ncbi:MAG TPA: hypothetical protein VGI39_38185 [Polyangiaceae bacterium]|jgi:hypothetical protein
MVDAPRAPEEGGGNAGRTDFDFTLKGWRSQLRWAMTQRDEDPARVWLEVISIDERSKRALAIDSDPAHKDQLARFRERLESSIASLTEELGDDNVAPLYSWLDLVRERRKMTVRIEEAKKAVVQARAMRLPDGGKPPSSEAKAVEQQARAQWELEQWKNASPPAPTPAVAAIWQEEGGDALRARLSHDPIAVARRGDEARAYLHRVAPGHDPGKHPWRGSRGERISIPVAGAAALLGGLFAALLGVSALWGVAALAAMVLGGLVMQSLLVRRQEKAERRAALDWAWHAVLYTERIEIAELEAGWLRELVEAHRALKTFDAKAGTGGQLRDFEQSRPDLAEIVHEVARDTESGA